jgi:hypothetical protein
MIVAQSLILLMALYQALSAGAKPRELLSPLSVVAFGFSWFYVGMYYALPATSRGLYINPTGYRILITVALLSLVAFAAGFGLGKRRRYPADKHRSVDPRLALRFAVILLVVAFSLWTTFIEISGGYLHFYSAIHGHAGRWAQTSAYIYTWKLFLYPAVFVIYLAYLDRMAKPWHGAVLLLSFAYLAADAYLMGSRGGWVRLMIVLAVPRLYLHTRRHLSRRAIYVLVPAIAALILVTPFIRNYTAIGKHHRTDLFKLASNILSSRDVLVGGVIGNELVVGTGLVTGAAQTATVGYGLDWLQPLINFIPRQIYPEKGHILSHVDRTALITKGMGAVPAGGSAFTGVPDTFLEFKWLAPLAWLAFGWWGGLRYRAVLSCPDWVNGGYLAAYLIGLVYLVTQGFGAAFYGWFYFAAAIWGMTKWAGARRAPRRRTSRDATPTEARGETSQGKTR